MVMISTVETTHIGARSPGPDTEVGICNEALQEHRNIINDHIKRYQRYILVRNKIDVGLFWFRNQKWVVKRLIWRIRSRRSWSKRMNSNGRFGAEIRG